MSEFFWRYAPYLPLIVCSVIALAFIVERSIIFLLNRQMSLLCADYEPETISKTLEVHSEAPSFYRAALLSLHLNASVNKVLRDEAASFALERSTAVLRKNLSGLVTISALAPMFGLLGTVIGLMRAFRDIGDSKGPVEPHLIADGLWQALATTAFGLIIAAICMIAHAIFSSLMRRLSVVI